MKEILIALLLLVAGFVLLIKGADFFRRWKLISC